MDVQNELTGENQWIETLKRYVEPDWSELVAGEWDCLLRLPAIDGDGLLDERDGSERGRI